MTWKQVVAIAAGITTIAGAAAAVGYRIDRPAWISELNELRTEVASNRDAIALQTYQRLKAVQATRPLTPEEQIVLCRAAAQIGIREAGCR